MHLSQHKLCTRKMELALEVKFSRLSLSLHVHGDERRPMEVTSNTYFRGVTSAPPTSPIPTIPGYFKTLVTNNNASIFFGLSFSNQISFLLPVSKLSHMPCSVCRDRGSSLRTRILDTRPRNTAYHSRVLMISSQKERTSTRFMIYKELNSFAETPKRPFRHQSLTCAGVLWCTNWKKQAEEVSPAVSHRSRSHDFKANFLGASSVVPGSK